MKGNVVDLAVGVIIGGAFGKIVSSLVEDVIMPPIGVVLGRVDFSSLFLRLPGQDAKILSYLQKNPGADIDAISLAQAKQAGIAVFAYGQFINQIIQFTIVAFAVFLLVKAINRAKAHVEPPTPASEPVTKECPLCLSDIPAKATRCKYCTAEIA